MICLHCKTTEATSSGRCAKCGREMTPMMGRPEPTIDLSKESMVVPTTTALRAFEKRVGADDD